MFGCNVELIECRAKRHGPQLALPRSYNTGHGSRMLFLYKI